MENSVISYAPASNIRGNKLQSELVKNCMKRHNFILNLVVDGWNSLSVEILESHSVNSFKSNLQSINIQEILDMKKNRKLNF